MGRKSRTKRQQEALRRQGDERREYLDARQAPQGTLGFEQTEIVGTFHSGPLPDPATLARYNEIVPGMAQGLYEDVRQQGRHRRRIESWRIGSDIGQSWLGTILAGAIAILTIWWSVGLIRDGHGLFGLAGIITALGSLAGIFVYARRQQAKSLAEKRP